MQYNASLNSFPPQFLSDETSKLTKTVMVKEDLDGKLFKNYSS